MPIWFYMCTIHLCLSCIYLHAAINVYIYICIDGSLNICSHTCIYRYTRTHTHIHIYIYIYSGGLKLRMPRSFPFFYPEDRTLLISGGVGSNLEWLARIFVIFRKGGSKFQSVNTKTSQFSPFFDLHEFEKNMSTPKVWEKNMSTTPKLINFPHFLNSRSLRKTCQHQN